MAELPHGTVTFLFTDVERSTARWERDAAAMRPAVERHFTLLQTAVAAHGGAVFKTIGDAIQAAFATAPAALAAALAAQRTLEAEVWPDATGPLRVRMALHTGEAQPQAGDYQIVPALNRLARLLAAGHGGQVLLSRATHELVRDALPDGAGLRDLGEQRLKDLYRPERVFQLRHPDLPSEFPPLKTLDARSNNLPRQPTPLIGREREVVQVVALLRRADVRLVTLTGSGGIGKTRLGLQAAADLLDEYPDGAWFVDLAPLADPALVPSAIAAALGVREEGRLPLEAALEAYLADKRLLLLPDNFEHVVDAAPLVAGLLAAAAGVKVLATSRVRLGLRGEHEVPVPPLGLPDPTRLPPVERLTQYEAVRLFVARAEAAAPGFAVDNANAPAVAAICHRLDGLPLAIELAAARVKLLAPQALLPRLERRLQVLTGGARDLPPRQRTLRAAIAWSHDLLSPDEQALFRQLAVFAGGATFAAAEAVTNPTDALDVFGGLAALVDQSLLRQAAGPDGEPRVAMLETVREFAREQLEQSGEAAAAQGRHAAHFLVLAEAAAPHLRGAEQGAWLGRLEAEHDNLRAALGWGVERDAAAALRLGAALGTFWGTRGHWSEGRGWLARALERAIGAPPEVRASALHVAGVLAHKQGDYARAAALYEEGLALRRALGDQGGIAASLNSLGNVAYERGDYARAATLHEESLALKQVLGDQRGIAASLGNLGLVAHERGDYARAAALLEEGLALFQALGDQRGIAASLQGLAWIVGAALRPMPAVRLLGAAEALRETLGVPLPPSERARHDRAVANVRAQLDEAAFAAAWEAGQALPLDEALAEALGVADELADAGSAPMTRHTEGAG